MRAVIYILFLLTTLQATAQQQLLGTDKVRINEPGGTILTGLTSATRTDLSLARVYYWYSGNTVHQTQGGYSGRLLHGSYQQFFTDKNLHVQGLFKNGLKDGEWKLWNEQGALLEQITWKGGIQDGPFTTFDPDGHPLKSGKYKNGLLNGKILQWYSADSVQKVVYRDGKPVKAKVQKSSWWQRLRNIKWKKRDQAKQQTKGA